MNTHSQPLNERLSALMDGDLPAAELDAVLSELAQHDASANDWHLYHLTGDVLRSNAMAPRRTELDFLQRLELRLAQESKVHPSVPHSTSAIPLEQPLRRVAANGPWRWVAGAAFTVLVGVLSIAMWGAVAPTPSPQLAVAPVPALNTASQDAPAVMLRDPQLDALMAAHQQMGGHSAWQMPSGFLRNATYERPAR